MDPKQIDPNLKQLYEKIMNTPIKGGPPSKPAQMAASQNVVAQTVIPIQAPTDFSSSQSPRSDTSFMSNVSKPLKNPAPTTFVFSSGQKSKTSPSSSIHYSASESSGFVSKIIIALLVIILLVAYSFFWLLIFGYVDQESLGI